MGLSRIELATIFFDSACQGLHAATDRRTYILAVARYHVAATALRQVICDGKIEDDYQRWSKL